MAKGGRKYRLVMYEYMLNRWWPMTMLVAFTIFLNVGVLWGAERYYTHPTDNPLPTLDSDGGTILLAVGVISLLFTFFLLIIRKMAYVQFFDDHLSLATPFLRMNISYKRVQHSTSAQLFALFPPRSLSAWNRDLIGPLSNSSAVVIHLSSYPLSRPILRLFLSPFFFCDKTPHLVLLVDNWMMLSTELDSRRTAGKQKPSRPQQQTSRRGTYGLLDDLKKK